MRHRSIWATGLALGLGLGLGMVGIALGQEPSGGGNWFTRLFAHGPTAVRKDEKEPVVPMISPATVRKQVLADYLRRLAVCDELHNVARETGDEELARKADMLEMRAKDAFIQRTNRAGGITASVDDETLENHLAPKGAGLTPLNAGTRTKSGNSRASLEDR